MLGKAPLLEDEVFTRKGITQLPISFPSYNRIVELILESRFLSEGLPLRHKQFLWSGDDRLMESTDDPGGAETIWRYAYDAAGERVLKWGDFGSGLEATAFIRDESGRTISEWNLLSGGSGFDVKTDYLYGAGREIAELQQGTTRSSESDTLFSPHKVTLLRGNEPS